jgi:hypothetical protein
VRVFVAIHDHHGLSVSQLLLSICCDSSQYTSFNSYQPHKRHLQSVYTCFYNFASTGVLANTVIEKHVYQFEGLLR